MATAPTVPDFPKWNFALNDTDEILIKDNARNAALKKFGENLKVMTDSINADLEVISGAYYGALAEDPTQDPNGQPMEAGDRYFNTTLNVEKSFNGTEWQANEVSAHLAEADPHTQYEFRVKHNTTATRAPTINDDSAAGYAPRSTWFDTSVTPPEAYRCINATAGAAKWVKTSLTLDELGSAATANTGDFDPAGAATQAVGSHEGKADPHTQYEKKATLKAGAYKGVLTGGYDGLAGSGLDLVDFERAVYASRAKYGAYSTPGSSPVNIDTVPPGFCGLVGGALEGTWPPNYDSSGFYWLECQRLYSGLAAVHRLTIYSSNLNARPRVWVRVIANDGTLGPWAEEYNSRTIVGLVAQTSGTPTGAIMEEDSNSFGSWVKFACGVMWCFGHIIETVNINNNGLLVGTWKRSSTFSYDFPQTFSGAYPSVELTPSYTAANADNYFNISLCQYTSINQTIRFGVSFMAPAEVLGAEVRFSWTAVGRWFN